ncbi:hypothetical protein HDV00_012318 [Rhizophlyctis rosea]|nr:hypothetical protein HDV00_012318 [Rhizophlyctis rosea]
MNINKVLISKHQLTPLRLGCSLGGTQCAGSRRVDAIALYVCGEVGAYLRRFGVLRRDIRVWPTPDERAAIAKEKAFIKYSFTEKNVETRHIDCGKVALYSYIGDVGRRMGKRSRGFRFRG